MQNLKQSAKQELLKLIIQLKSNRKKLNIKEFLAVLEEMKYISEHTGFIEATQQSLELLSQIKLESKCALTKREIEVLELIGHGLKNTTIAKGLNLSKSTVETHRKNIRKKLELNNAENLFAYALIYNIQKDSYSYQDNKSKNGITYKLKL